MKDKFVILICLAALVQVWGIDPSQQPVNSWLKRTTGPQYQVPSPYENDFEWDYNAGGAILAFGHLNLNTNRTWKYTHSTDALTATKPFHRPHKR
jgi:hypothetical protein